MHLILFLLFAGFCLGGAINLLLQSHPINSALSLIVVMTSLAVLYLLLGAEFLAAAQIIVYAGAIMVLFVLTVMLLIRRARRAHHGQPHLARRRLSRSGDGLRRDCHSPAARTPDGQCRTAGWHHLHGRLSRVLFHELLLPFEVTSVLILIAILGAVALARHGHGDPHGDSERTGTK